MSIYDPPMISTLTYKHEDPDIPKDAVLIGTASFKAEIWTFNETGVKILVNNILDEFKNGNYKNTRTYQYFIEKKLYKNTKKTNEMIYLMIRDVMISKGIEIFQWTEIMNIIFTNNLELECYTFQGLGVLWINDFESLMRKISQIIVNDNELLERKVLREIPSARYFKKQWGIYHHISKPDLIGIRFIVFGCLFKNHYDWFVDKQFYKDYFDLGNIFKHRNPHPKLGLRKDVWGFPFPKCRRPL